MDTYSFLRQLADSWVLLAMVLFYITACLWAFRPGARRANDEAAGIPLRNDGDAHLQSQEPEAE
jgi:cytochrome c oxidase cbb3-type subunit IV